MIIRVCWLCVAAMLMWTPSAEATVSGAAAVGGFIQGVKETRTHRQLVATVRSGSVYAGRPENSVVGVLTLALKDELKAPNLLLQETEFEDGRIHFSVTAPQAIQESTSRLTIVLDAPPLASTLYASEGDQWTPIGPTLISHGAGAGDRTAFAVRQPGDFWLIPDGLIGDRTETLITLSESSGANGDLTRGFWHWLWALAVLAAFWGISALRHAADIRRSAG